MIQPSAATWMDLEIIILSEVRKQGTNSTRYHLYVGSKNSTNEIIYKTETFTDTENRPVVAKREREESGIDREFGVSRCKLCIYRIDTQQGPTG